MPLVQSLQFHEPKCDLIVIDNESKTPYPEQHWVFRRPRCCYSAAINYAKVMMGAADWYIVLSNDVLCTGPFIEELAHTPPTWVAGPCLKQVHGYNYLEGWCVCIPADIWQELGGWDDNYRISSWEDVDFSTMALKAGYNLAHMPDLPFKHMDQRQRFTIVPDYWQSEEHNVRYFFRKHEGRK